MNPLELSGKSGKDPVSDGLELPLLIKEIRPGESCPQCHIGKLDYDGTLNLACPNCGFTLAGCFT